MSSTKPKPARNRLRRSCDVCFKSKTKCDDHRPCNQCIRRKCEDRCLTSGQAPSLLDGIQTPSSTTFEGKARSDTQSHSRKATSSTGTPGRGPSLETQRESREVVRTQQPEGQTHTQMQTQKQTPGSSQTPYQTWSARPAYRAESPLAPSLTYEQPSGDHSKLPNGRGHLQHVWNADGPGKGRTHYLWLLRKFTHILPYIDEDTRAAQVRRVSTHAASYGRPESPKTLDQNRSEILSAVFTEIPKRDVCIGLIDLYFNNYAQVFPILDHKEFEKSYYMVMSSHEVFVRDINFVVLLLLVLLLGNTLVEPCRQGVLPDTATRWLGLVQSWQNKVMATASFGFEQIHTFILFNLVRQVTQVNPAADYISLGSAIRAAMINGTHKPPQLLFGTGYTARVPWTALIELDLQGSIATGLVPTTATIVAQDEQTRKTSSLFINEIWTALANTIHLRHDILIHLNSELVIKHQHAVDAARELTSVVGPTLKTSRKSQNVFAYEYLNFVYKRYLFALHRPFALMDDPGYHFSQRICSNLSFQHIERICRIHQTPAPNRTPFENLLIGYNTMFWDESFQAVMFLCHSLLRAQSVEDEIMDTIMLGDDLDRSAGAGGISGGGGNHNVSSTAIRMVLHAYVPVAGENLKEDSWLAEQAYLVPAITLAYLDVSKQFSEQKNPEKDWECMWKETQAKVVDRCLELEARFNGTSMNWEGT